MATVEERVASGVYMLDIFSPDWRKKIDLARLDIRSCRDCVLGQVFGEYEDGMRALGLWNAEEDKVTHPMVHPAMLGFSIHNMVNWGLGSMFTSQYEMAEQSVFDALHDAWIVELTA